MPTEDSERGRRPREHDANHGVQAQRAHILKSSSDAKGAAELRCRQLDGRAAILVVARPGGFGLGRLGQRTARTSFVCRPDTTICSRHGTPGSRTDNWRGSSSGAARPPFHSTSRLIAGTSPLTIALLVVWLLGMFGVYRVGDLVHVFLLVGLMLLLLAVLKAQDAALRHPESPNND